MFSERERWLVLERHTREEGSLLMLIFLFLKNPHITAFAHNDEIKKFYFWLMLIVLFYFFLICF